MEKCNPPDGLSSTDNRPIGVFDSGIGGLSILKSLLHTIPHRPFIYLADTGYAPYGERSDEYIIMRSQKITRWLHSQKNTAALVIACNTATAAAARTLRQEYEASWPIIGVEPGLKPAMQQTVTGRISVMATGSTLKSKKYNELVAHIQTLSPQPLEVFSCPCNGLAKAIEDDNAQETDALIAQYTQQVKSFGCDVVVLGCTHYCLVKEKIESALPHIHVLDTPKAIAKRTAFLLHSNEVTDLQNSPQHPVMAYTSGSKEQLENAFSRWLPDVRVEVHEWHE